MMFVVSVFIVVIVTSLFAWGVYEGSLDCIRVFLNR